MNPIYISTISIFGGFLFGFITCSIFVMARMNAAARMPAQAHGDDMKAFNETIEEAISGLIPELDVRISPPDETRGATIYISALYDNEETGLSKQVNLCDAIDSTIECHSNPALRLYKEKQMLGLASELHGLAEKTNNAVNALSHARQRLLANKESKK